MRTLYAVSLLIVVLLSGCTIAEPPDRPPVHTSSSAVADVVTATPSPTDGKPTDKPVSDALIASIAHPGAPLRVYTNPDTAAVAPSLPAKTKHGALTTVLVLERRPGWDRIALPTRPNGSTGWVRDSDVTVSRVSEKVAVGLKSRTITISRPGYADVFAPVAIGTDADPTPVGNWFVTDSLSEPAGGAYGHHALGLSAHSDVLTSFAGGDGQIGIHGTNEPSSIGQAASHGCIRVPPQIEDILPSLPLGTPVEITASG